MKLRQIKLSVLAVLMIAILSIGCSKDDDTQPQTETPTAPPVAEADKAPVISAQTFTSKEDIKDDVVIGNIVATDPESKALTFVLIQNSNDLFELTATGELSLATDKKLDFETVTSHTLTIEVSDGKNKASADITITVENVVEPFITTWETTTANEKVTIKINNNFIYDYTIDWGDGTIENNKTDSSNHDYKEAGVYTVSISGIFPAFRVLEDSKKKIKTIEQWGDNKWEFFTGTFGGCENMTYNATDIPNLSMVTDMNSMFVGATSFNGDLSNWDVSNVTGMAYMFKNATSFNGDLSTWNVGNVTYMGFMFHNATSFNGDLSTWNVSNVTYMGYMFNGATSFNSDLSKWNVSKVTGMENMLDDTKISGADYDKLLTEWAALPNLQSNVTFGVEGLVYCDAVSARNTLINNKGWTIDGDKPCPR